MATTHEERTRLQLHSNEMTMSMVSLRQELDDNVYGGSWSTAIGAPDGRAASSESDYRGSPSPGGDQQCPSFTAYNSRTVQSDATAQHSSNENRWCHSQHSLRASIFNSINGATHNRASWTGILPCWLTTGSNAEQMRAMYGREEADPPRRDPPTNEQGGKAGRVRMFQHSRAVNTAYKRVLKFGTTKIPKLTKSTLVNTEVQPLIQYIHQLLRHEAFDDSVLENLIDNETVTLLEYIFHPTETASRR